VVPPSSKDPEELNISVVDVPIVLKKGIPYKLADVRQVSTSEQFSQASNSQIQALLLAVCRVKSPIHVDELMKRVLKYWGIARTGARKKLNLRNSWLSLPMFGIFKSRIILYLSPTKK
jgi:ABC-type uncharacterized transport system YnjBCD permease subunit